MQFRFYCPWIKFYWNTAAHTYSHIAFGCFRALRGSSSDGECVVPRVPPVYYLVFTENLLSPGFIQTQRRWSRRKTQLSWVIGVPEDEKENIIRNSDVKGRGLQGFFLLCVCVSIWNLWWSLAHRLWSQQHLPTLVGS